MKNGKLTICPLCHRVGTVIRIGDINTTHCNPVYRFCTHCSFVSFANRPTGSSKNKLSDKLLKETANNIKEISEHLFRPWGVCTRLNINTFNKSLIGIMGYRKHTKYMKEIVLPVFTAWNYCSGQIRINKQTAFPTSNKGAVCLLADSYLPDVLFITDNPIVGLAIKYKAAAFTNKNVSVLITIDNREVDLPLYQYSDKIVILMEKGVFKDKLLEKLNKEDIIYNSTYVGPPLIEDGLLKRVLI